MALTPLIRRGRSAHQTTATECHCAPRRRMGPAYPPTGRQFGHPGLHQVNHWFRNRSYWLASRLFLRSRRGGAVRQQMALHIYLHYRLRWVAYGLAVRQVSISRAVRDICHWRPLQKAIAANPLKAMDVTYGLTRRLTHLLEHHLLPRGGTM